MDQPQSQVIRLSTVAIIAWAQGETDQIMAELAAKLPGMAEKMGALFESKTLPQSFGSCKYHRGVLLVKRAPGLWICPEIGCGYYAGDMSEVDPEVAACWRAEIADKSRDVKGGSSEHANKRKKPLPLMKFYPLDQK